LSPSLGRLGGQQTKTMSRAGQADRLLACTGVMIGSGKINWYFCQCDWADTGLKQLVEHFKELGCIFSETSTGCVLSSVTLLKRRVAPVNEVVESSS
jgi:hypothetical protein